MKKNPNRNRRLSLARDWIKKYSGKNLVIGYSKKYCVGKLCAVKELRMLGVEVSDEYEKQLIISMEESIKQKKLLKERREEKLNYMCGFESDENFAMILGYTSGGFPYGVTHEEMDEINNEE